MKGDFSKFEFYPQATHLDLRTDNLTGVMHQQGRGLTDQDWNAGDQINRYLRQRQARDVIGANVVGVPSDAAESFHISGASRVGDSVNITLQPGRVWVDGLHLVYDNNGPSTRNINYFGSPVQIPTASADDIASGRVVRDAVVLEVWEEALNGFQDVEHLIEGALGGVDTTERVKVFHHISLYRLGPDDDCHSIARLLDDAFNNKGHLSISPDDSVVIAGPCPVELGGGYSGFEHYLYRIEIATVDAEGQAQFKWSRFNGGLVGRGTLTDDIVTLTANEQMINHCGLNSFYLEALQENTQDGHWEITFSARASLDEGQLNLSGIQGTWPAGNNDAFLRLWDGIDRIERFSDELAEAREFEPGLGIRAAFSLPTADNRNYSEGDYWSFPVRAGGVHTDISQWPTDQPPYGVHSSRAPLAIIEWPANPPAQADSPGNIFDCRKVFQPLTHLDTCCTITVGNGTESQGDVDNIQTAINQLPTQGGVVCVLSGVHYANAVIENKENIIIRGCGKTTKIVPLIDNAEDAIFSVTDSKCIVFEQMDIIAADRRAFLLQGSEQGLLTEISIQHNRILACEHAIYVRHGEHINIEQNKLRILDKEQGDVAIYMQGEDSLIERNEIIVIPFEQTPPVDTPEDEDETDPTQPCFRIRFLIANPLLIPAYWNQIWNLNLIALPDTPYRTQSGIQLAGSSERVQIRRNIIKGGAGNGITLGSAIPAGTPEEENPDAEKFTVRALNGISGRILNQDGSPAGDLALSIVNDENISFSTLSGSTSGEFFYSIDDGEYPIFITDTDYEISNITTQALGNRLFYNLVIKETEQEIDIDDDISGFIYDINIQANEITDMGLNGIGGPQLQNVISTETLPRSTPLPENTNLFLSAGNRNAGNATERIAALFSSIIIGLHIHHNVIQNCLSNAFNTAMLAHARTSGMGGIALGWAEYAIIENNRIENNGRRHLDPVCGIVARGSVFTLRDNQIINNGPVLRTNASSSPLPGIRGGIALLAVSFSFSRFLSSSFRTAPDDEGIIADDSMAAAIVHNNMVQQPAGPALMMIAYGPLQISNNRFSTEISAVSLGSQVFRNLGPVAIAHAGVPVLSGLSSRLRPALINIRNSAESTEAFTGSIINTNLSSMRINAETGDPESAQFNRITPGATVLFNNNQSRLGVARGSIASQFIISNGDISFGNNQSTVNIYDEELWFNTALDAETLRATSNRFIELTGRNSKRLQDAFQTPANSSRSIMLIQNATMGIRVTDELVAGALNASFIKPFSLLSRTGRMNNTSHNQGDHCIAALPLPGSLAAIPTIADANQVSLQDACTRYIKQLDSLATAAIEGSPIETVLSLLR